MLPQIVKVGPLLAPNTSLIATSQTPTSGTALTLTGTNPDVARRVLLTYGNEASGRTLVVIGTNATGNPIYEVLTVPSGGSGTVYTLQDFLTVTELLPLGGGWTAAVTVGTNGVASSPWKVLTYHITPVNLGIGVVVSGTVNYTVEYTYDNPNNNQNVLGSQSPLQAANYPAVPTPWPVLALQNQSSDADGAITTPIFAWRLTLNSQTNPGSATATGIQGGIAQG